MTAAPRFSGVLYGAAYYAEYQPVDRTERDLDLMQEAGFTVIRVGESVWSTWEPREGDFDLEWLLPVLDGAHARGIGVILGMPTYAVPMWLARRHPEIAAESATGQRVGWGGRQEMDQSHPAYRFFAERIVRKVTERYAGHPAVIGYQVDNEPGLLLPHNEGVFQRFVDWLRSRYGTVEALNEAWGLVYWSHRLSDWADLWRPDGNYQPQYDLEWRRFQSTLATELISWQADVVREYARDDQFITTCISYPRPQVADDQLVANLDVVAGNPYYRMQDALDQPATVAASPERWWHTGVWALHQWGDRAWSSADCQYLVTETDAQSIGGPWSNHPPYPGQLRQAAFALLSRGGRMVEYWHWHTLHFGTETYWGGVLPHSGEPGRVYREVAEIGAAFRAIGSALDDYTPDADVLMLYSTDTKWSYSSYPPLADAAGGPDRHAYEHILDAYYQGLFEAGAQVRYQHVARFLRTPVEELVRRHPVLLAPALYVAGDEVLAHLRAYAEAGGHLVLGIRTGYGDELARARAEVAPARLTDAARLRYDVYSNLEAPLPVTSDALELESGAAGEHWIDVLEPEGAEVLARFTANELGAEAALTSAPFGAGRVSYLPTVPNPALARSIARWLVPDRASAAWSAGPSVSVATGVSAGRRIAFVSNWSSTASEVVVPAAMRDLVTGAQHAAGSPLLLAPRSAVVLEATDSSTE
ncbi:beta-galactosidase [Pseudolysinimonas sp.]|uniref:beta-galactosidase n=1 Tax=Pseudolysinimonas sp. TaxID=2680009 RepID=UPI003F80E2F6